MCNIYSITRNQAAIAALFRVVNRYVGNLAPMPGVFPDYPAPVIRNTDTGTEMVLMRRCAVEPARQLPNVLRAGVDRQGCAGVNCSCRRQDRVHRARKPLGERLLRELQLEASRRTAQQRDLLQPRRGQGHH
jgi:hypothetical protein